LIFGSPVGRCHYRALPAWRSHRHPRPGNMCAAWTSTAATRRGACLRWSGGH